MRLSELWWPLILIFGPLASTAATEFVTLGVSLQNESDRVHCSCESLPLNTFLSVKPDMQTKRVRGMRSVPTAFNSLSHPFLCGLWLQCLYVQTRVTSWWLCVLSLILNLVFNYRSYQVGSTRLPEHRYDVWEGYSEGILIVHSFLVDEDSTKFYKRGPTCCCAALLWTRRLLRANQRFSREKRQNLKILEDVKTETWTTRVHASQTHTCFGFLWHK